MSSPGQLPGSGRRKKKQLDANDRDGRALFLNPQKEAALTAHANQCGNTNR